MQRNAQHHNPVAAGKRGCMTMFCAKCAAAAKETTKTTTLKWKRPNP